jgi:hypothetical protein
MIDFMVFFNNQVVAGMGWLQKRTTKKQKYQKMRYKSQTKGPHWVVDFLAG